MTSDSESSSGSAMKSHPGDCAAPLEVLEWLDKFDEKIESTSYGQVRRGQIPAALLRSTCRTSPSTLWSRPGLPHGRHPRSGTGLRTRPATTSRPDYQPAGGQEVADSHSLSTLWRYASSCNFNNFGVLAFFRGCFRSLCLCRGAFGQLLAFGSHSLLDVTTLSSATTCPVLLPCDPVTAL